MMSRTLFIFCLLIGINQKSIGQNTLTLQKAIEIAIDNNYGIQLAQHNIRITENNTDKRNHGYYPIIDASAGPSITFGGSSQQFEGGMKAETSNALSWTAGASVNASYNLLDKSRDLQFDQIKEILTLSNLQLRQTIESTVIQVCNQYYLIAQLTENLRAVKEALSVSNKRKMRAQLRYELGQGLRLDILNAQVDISRDSVNYLNVKQQVTNAKRDLEVILGNSLLDDYQVESSVNYRTDLTTEDLYNKALDNNVSILLSNQNQVINEYDLEIINAVNKPRIGTSAGYNYNYQDNAPGSFISSSTNSGINLGVTLNWNIFDGGRKKVLEQNALINIEAEQLNKDQLTREIQRDINNAWGNYTNALFVLEVEKNSLETNRLNLERTTELFNSGQLSSVDFRQAQLNLLNSETGYNSARFDAKLIELQLVFLSGEILNLEY